MDLDEAREVVREQHRAVLATIRADGTPAMSPVLLAGFFGRWVQVEGRVEIISLPDAMDGLVDYYRRISGEHDDWDEYRAAMVRDRRVLLRVTVGRAGPNRQG